MKRLLGGNRQFLQVAVLSNFSLPFGDLTKQKNLHWVHYFLVAGLVCRL